MYISFSNLTWLPKLFKVVKLSGVIFFFVNNNPANKQKLFLKRNLGMVFIENWLKKKTLIGNRNC